MKHAFNIILQWKAHSEELNHKIGDWIIKTLLLMLLVTVILPIKIHSDTG